MNRITRFLGATLAMLCMAGEAHLAFAAPPAPDLGRETAKGINGFAVDMYLELARGEGNVVFSPQNISSALAMTYAGASEPVAKEMAKVLHFGPDVHKGMGELERRVESDNADDCRVTTANAVWPAKDVALNRNFENVVKANYRSEIRQLDYAANPEKARATINRWVERKTNDLIKDLIPQGGVNKATPMVLTSAIHFLGKWQEPFDKAATQDAPFYGAQQTNVKMMYKQESAAYSEKDGTRMIRMPYRGGRYSMIVALPAKETPFAKYEASLKDGKALAQMQALFSPEAKTERVQIYVPKFKIETSYGLRENFEKLGMKKAFEGNAFGGMLASSKNKRLIPLYIGEIYHKAYIAVDEEQTEAAAATGVVMLRASARPSEPVVFRADRPFLYFLVENGSGAILFMGRYVKP